MGRPKKNTVDYFPHMAKHGKTLFILQQHFGNNGYAVWFKTLELLACTENHYINLNKDEDFEFFVAKMGVSATETIDILNLLAKIDKIDKNLWAKRVIWCQNFINNLFAIYEKRNGKIPEKPSLREINPVSVAEMGVSDVRNPNRIEKNRKEKNILQSDDCDEYLFSDQLKKMFTDKDKRMPIIAYYWTIKKIKYPNKETYQAGLKRELRAAKDLKGYPNEQIKKTCQWLQDNADFKWTLETVHKYIDENLENLGQGGKKLSQEELWEQHLKNK